MKPEILHDNLINAIRERLPQGVSMANVLTEILSVGKEAVYRRIRGEVPFTFYEISLIMEHLKMSSDVIMGLSTTDSALFHLHDLHYTDLRDSDYKLFEEMIRILEDITSDPESEFGLATNILPQTFSLKYAHLSKFRAFRWAYQYEKIHKVKPYYEIEIPAKYDGYQKGYVKQFQHMNASYYILDRSIFKYLINDIQYFLRINLLRLEDIQAIKKIFLTY